MVCLENTRNIAPLAEGTEIGVKSNWVTPGDYPDQLDITTSHTMYYLNTQRQNQHMQYGHTSW